MTITSTRAVPKSQDTSQALRFHSQAFKLKIPVPKKKTQQSAVTTSFVLRRSLEMPLVYFETCRCPHPPTLPRP